MKKPKLTYKRLKKMLTYSKSTGLFHWINNNGHGVCAGDVAGSKTSLGYIVINIYGKLRAAHRLAHFYVNGFFPDGDVDHEDRIKHNNKWKNICGVVSRQKNCQNTNNFSHNTSGVKGVSFCKMKKKYIAYVCVAKKIKKLGSYKDFDEAVCARLVAEQCVGWHGISPAYQYVKDNIL